MRQSAVRELEIPLSLPDPYSSDDQPVCPPNFVFLKPQDAANSNPPRPSRSRGDTIDAPIRIASCIGYLNGLIQVWLLAKRPEYARIIEPYEEQFYDRLCREGADIIFGAGGSIGFLQRIKLDPLLCDIPLVIVDSYDYTNFADTRARFATLGAEAILRLPITLEGFLGVIEPFVPEYRPSDQR